MRVATGRLEAVQVDRFLGSWVVDQRLRQVERDGTPAEKLQARRRIGMDEKQAWAGLVSPASSYEEVMELAKALEGVRFLGLTRQRCGPSEGETARFEHEATGLVLRLTPAIKLWLRPPGGSLGAPKQEVFVRPILLCETPCTQKAWDRFAQQAGAADRRYWQGEDLPIGGVDWEDAKRWCDEVGLRLPSEFEWEFSVRGGSRGDYCFGSDARELPAFAWFEDNAEERTWPVRSKRPNALGLYDVHGNVSEWCEYEWSEDVNAPLAAWFADADKDTSYRVYRGGSFVHSAADCSLESRDPVSTGTRYTFLGFRPALSLP